ncbi:MAG: DUF4403 family protein [Saprospiraceae bacterium]|nr:DUF4403 family protein [Saprospiraceae bacterium]MBP7699403.1 DUF4403 family protein [Saprospiraceae bacterium]
MKPLLTLGTLLLLWGCGGNLKNEPTRPIENYNNITVSPVLSSINIPLTINIKDIEKYVNNSLKGVLYESGNVSGGGMGDMKIVAYKSANISIQMNGQSLTYRVPLLISIEKDIAVSTLKADGEMFIDLTTAFDVKNDWSIQTNTSVVSHNWTKSPKLAVGGLKIPIQFVADQVLAYSKGRLSAAIDDAVKSNLLIKPYIQDAWSTAQQPLQLSKEYNMWMQLRPQDVTMTPLQTANGLIRSTVTFQGFSDIQVGSPTQSYKPIALPAFKYANGNNTSNDFNFNVNVTIPFREAEAISKNMLVGQTFTQGKYFVNITDIRMYGQGDYLIINALLTGSYNGNIYLSGKPIYNANTNEVELENLVFELNTKSFLLKSAKWLFNRKLINMIQKTLKFQVAENINAMKSTIQQQLKNYQIAPNVILNGNVEELRISGIQVIPDNLNVRFFSKGNLLIDVKGI